jgi:hypothetical protein
MSIPPTFRRPASSSSVPTSSAASGLQRWSGIPVSLPPTRTISLPLPLSSSRPLFSVQQLSHSNSTSYPASACSGNESPQEIFPLFLNHTSGVKLVEPYLNSAKVAQAIGRPLLMLETNSAACGGFPGVSDSFGAALWTLDYSLQMAYSNFSGAMFHVDGLNVSYNVRPILVFARIMLTLTTSRPSHVSFGPIHASRPTKPFFQLLLHWKVPIVSGPSDPFTTPLSQWPKLSVPQTSPKYSISAPTTATSIHRPTVFTRKGTFPESPCSITSPTLPATAITP